MVNRSHLVHVTVALSWALLASCGEGGGNSPAPVAVAPNPAPAPTPTPAPTPAPTPTPLSGPAAITLVGEFSVLGYELSYTTTAINGNDRQDVLETFDGTRFRYLASGTHQLLLPLFEWTPLGAAFVDGAFSVQNVVEPGGAKSYQLTMLIPGVSQLPLSYTGFASWYLNRLVLTSSGRQLHLTGKFAYGVATPAGSLPLTGGVTYRGFGDFEGYGNPSPTDLMVDYATGQIAGQITPHFSDFGGGPSIPPGTLTFAGVLPHGSSAATADVQLPNGKVGKIDIQFTGPGGEELMFRFRGIIPCTPAGGECVEVASGAARRNG